MEEMVKDGALDQIEDRRSTRAADGTCRALKIKDVE
jgi:hypothetical protein